MSKTEMIEVIVARTRKYTRIEQWTEMCEDLKSKGEISSYSIALKYAGNAVIKVLLPDGEIVRCII